MSDVHVLIPCKALREGKSRLGAVLDVAARYALCRRLLLHSLALALELAPAHRIHVVADDSEVEAVAAGQGIATIHDRGADLNGALTEARSGLPEAHCVLVMPIDLPLAEARSARAVVRTEGDVIIVPDRHGRGTNMLCLGPLVSGSFRFSFGEDSLAVHRRLGEAAGYRVRVSHYADIAFDLDTVEDLELWNAAQRE